jgi:hypothetical protein
MRRDSQSGMTLIMVVGVIAALAVLAGTVTMVTSNTMKASARDRTGISAFDVSEAVLDNAMYQIGSTWPASASDFTWSNEGFLADTTAWPASEYPDLVTSAKLSTAYVDDDPSKGVDSDAYWVVAQASYGGRAASIKTKVARQSIGVATLAPGVAVYSGGTVTMTGSTSVSGSTAASIYAGTALSVSGGNPSIPSNVSIYTPSYNPLAWQISGHTVPATVTGTTVPPLSQFFPSDLVASLTAASQIAPNSGTAVSNSSPGFSWPWGGTYASPAYCIGDLHVNTQGVYNFGSLYVAGNLQIDGNATMNCTALYVGGNLTVSGGANTQSFGPTYVGGNVSFSGNQRFDIPLLVTAGSVSISGSQVVGGNGVGTNPVPCMMVMVGTTAKEFNYSGNCQFTGVLANMTGGGVNVSGSNAIDGAVYTGGSVNLSGTGSVYYDAAVVNAFSSSVTTAAKIVSGTWQEITPTPAP